MRQAFVDTSAFVALLDRRDPRHESARATFLDFIEDGELVTHGYVVAETIAVTRRRFGVEGVITLLDDLLPVVTLLPVEPALHADAQARYRSSLPSGTSFVDQVSIRVIERDRIEVAFALDADFERARTAVVPTSAPRSDAHGGPLKAPDEPEISGG